jgi:hypothetical protein
MFRANMLHHFVSARQTRRHLNLCGYYNMGVRAHLTRVSALRAADYDSNQTHLCHITVRSENTTLRSGYEQLGRSTCTSRKILDIQLDMEILCCVDTYCGIIM